MGSSGNATLFVHQQKDRAVLGGDDYVFLATIILVIEVCTTASIIRIYLSKLMAINCFGILA